MFERIEQFYSHHNFIVIVLIRIVIFLVLAVLLFAIGLMIGYSVLGDGANPLEVFSRQVWQNITDFIN